MCEYAYSDFVYSVHVPVVFKVSASNSHSAVQHVDDTDTHRVGQGGYQPQEVGTVCCKHTSLSGWGQVRRIRGRRRMRERERDCRSNRKR